MQSPWTLDLASGVMLKYGPGKVPVDTLAGGEDLRDLAATLLRLAQTETFDTMPGDGVPWGVINLAGYTVCMLQCSYH
jgi:hypothetical protein